MNKPSDTPILQMRGISKRFGAVQALSEVDFEVYLGEVVGLVGDNGAGKSTLIKIISGVYQADSGHYIFEGREVNVTNPRRQLSWGSRPFIKTWPFVTTWMSSPICIWVGKRFNPSF